MTVFNVSQASVAIADSDRRFPVRRIFCIGRNYAAHAREMGGDPDREPPFYFNKAADTVVASGSVVDYPPRTDDLQHEIELVVAIKKEGRNISVSNAGDHVFGYAVGIDLTRRDLQAQAKASGWPWDVAKNFDQSAPVGAIHAASAIGHPGRGRIWLSVNDEIRQDGNLDEMIWTVPQLLAEISTYCALAAGDLVFTGTPAGVGRLVPGDKVTGGIEGVGEIGIKIR
jgi:fumarylpyruvate hydrolase